MTTRPLIGLNIVQILARTILVCFALIVLSLWRVALGDDENFTSIEHGPHMVMFTLEGGVPVEWRLRIPRPGGMARETLIDPAITMSDSGRPLDLVLSQGDVDLSEIVNRAGYALARTTEGSTEVLRFTSPRLDDGLRIIKTYRFAGDRYAVGHSIELRNEGDRTVTLGDGKNNFAIRLGPRLGSLEAVAPSLTRGVLLSADGVVPVEPPEDGLESDRFTPAGIEWAGIENRYFLLALKSGDSAGRLESAILSPISELQSDTDPATQMMQLELAVSQISIAPGESAVLAYRIYAGPKTAAAFAEDSELKQLFFADLWFWMQWLCLGIQWLLSALYLLLQNWGLALISLAVVIRLILVPVGIAAQRHQARTQLEQARIKPALQRINEEFKGDFDKKHLATKQLYEEHGMSMLAPLTGCLWVLIQIPIFIGLYFVIGESFELRGVGFLWMEDLALPDRLLSFGFEIPYFGPYLNLLPVLMAASQVLVSGQSAPGADPKQVNGQRKAMGIMALVFFFLLYNFPAALMLYWLCTNLLQSMQQAMVVKWDQRAADTSSG